MRNNALTHSSIKVLEYDKSKCTCTPEANFCKYCQDYLKADKIEDNKPNGVQGTLPSRSELLISRIELFYRWHEIRGISPEENLTTVGDD